MVARVEHDLEYIRRWSLWLDIKILFLTAFGRKVRQNAY
jgi:putative colanic acid biosynthesis UDP-glucose lipid carrier transferase